MASRCISGKRPFATQTLAEDALIELWMNNEYSPGQAPIAIYKCEDCGEYHFTSRSPMNERLEKEIMSGKVHRQREAKKWEEKLRKK
jgi:hypothetical protein